MINSSSDNIIILQYLTYEDIFVLELGISQFTERCRKHTFTCR